MTGSNSLQKLELTTETNDLSDELVVCGMPKISIIIPVYNSTRFLPAALESVFSQNYASYEIVVVDDGSTDETAVCLQPYANRIRYVYQTNAGSAAARNTGLDLARGEYIVFLDADDLLLPGKLKEQAAFLDLRPSLGMVHSGWRIIDEQGQTVTDVTPWREAPTLDLDTWLRRKPVKMGAMMIRRAWLESVGGLDVELRQSHDVDLMLRLSLAGCQAEWVYKPTLCYRHHKDSTIRRNALNHAMYVTRVLDKFFAHPNIPTAVVERENQTRYYSFIWLAWHLYRSGFQSDMESYLRQSLAYSRDSVIRIVLDWTNLFVKWSSADGMNVSRLHDIWPSFRQAAVMPEDTWIILERFLDWRITRIELTGGIVAVDERVLWRLFETIDQHGGDHHLTADLFLDWWVKVWQPYTSKKFVVGRESLAEFKALPAEQVVSLAQVSILALPNLVSMGRIRFIWNELVKYEVIPKEFAADRATLYLTYSGQAVLGRHWKKAFKPFLLAGGLAWRKRGRRAWGQFIRKGWNYYRNGR